MKPGIYGGLTNAEYHGGAGVSKSMLDILANQTPLHLHAKRIAAANDNGTKAQFIGSEFHALLLEPAEFVKEYTLAFRQSDMPEAIDSRDQLVAMAEAINAEREAMTAGAVNGVDGLKAMIMKLNETRLPKLSTSGGKDTLVSLLLANVPGCGTREELDALKAADLKAKIEAANEGREGQLAISGGAAELAERLRAAGQEFFTRQEMLDEWQAMHGRPMFIDVKSSSMRELADALRANGKTLKLWAEVKAEWDANNGHRRILTPEQWTQIHNMRDAVLAHPAASALMTMRGKAEQSVYWVDEATGELCRCRPDWWPQEMGMVVDVKTTEDASPEGFAKSIVNWRYHVQHPYYLDGIAVAIKQSRSKIPAPKAFVFLVVEKTACVVNGKAKGVAVYVLDQDGVALGRAEYKRDLQVYAECNRTGIWPGYGDKIQNISVPQWHIARNANLISSAAA